MPWTVRLGLPSRRASGTLWVAGGTQHAVGTAAPAGQTGWGALAGGGEMVARRPPSIAAVLGQF